MARLLSVNVGLPREVHWRGRIVRTAIWKAPVQGRRRVTRLNVEGDGQADLSGHGGEQRAVFVYQIESYRYWEETLGRRDLTHGQFGENLTVEGLADERNLLELAEACDVPVRWSCRSGVCHNCESGLISGSVAYQPGPLDPPADGNVLICCSHPQSDVVIDI